MSMFVLALTDSF